MLENLPLTDIREDYIYKTIDADHRAMLRAAEESFEYFCSLAGYPPADFHLEWTEIFFNNLDSVILAPRNHAKSTWIMLLCAWIMIFPERWRKHFNLRHQFLELSYVTSTYPVGTKHMKKFIIELKNFIKVLRLGGQIKFKEANVGVVQLSNLSKLEMGSITGSIRGMRSHFMFNDDLQKDKGQKVEEVTSIYEGSVYPLRFPRSHNIIVGTAKADNDILHQYLNNEEWVGKKYKAINERVNESGVKENYALWESAYIDGEFHENRPLESLYNIKLKITPVTFSREYQNEPVSDEFAIMPLTLLRPCIDTKLIVKDIKQGTAKYLSVDLASSDTPTADYTVVTALEVDQNYDHREIPVVIIREQWVFHASSIKATENKELGIMEKEPFYRPIIKKIAEMSDFYQPSKVFVEDNAFQSTMVHMLKDPNLVGSSNIPAVGIRTGTEKHSQNLGIPIIRAMLSARRLIFPWGDLDSVEQMSRLQDELQKWYEDPMTGDFECAATHDDQSMSLYIGLKGIVERIGSFIGGAGVSGYGITGQKNIVEKAEAKAIEKIKETIEDDGQNRIIIPPPRGIRSKGKRSRRR